MKLLIVTSRFDLDEAGGASPARELAEALAERGWSVEVLTGMSKGSEDRSLRRGFWHVERRDRIRLVELSSSAIPLAVAGMLQRPDVIVSVRPVSITPSLGNACLTTALKVLWNCPVLTWVSAPSPSHSKRLSGLEPGRMHRFAERVKKFAYRNSERIAVGSKRLERQLIRGGVPENRLLQIPKWANFSALEPSSAVDAIRTRLGYLPGDFLLVYAGALTGNHGLETLILAMKRLEFRQDIHLLIAGDGPRRGSLEGAALRFGLKRVRFLGAAAMASFPELMRAADLLLLSQSARLVDAVMPNKLPHYMAAGKPILAAVHADGETAAWIESAACGVVVAPEFPPDIADAILELQALPVLRGRLGQAAANFAKSEFDKPRVIDRFEETINLLVAGRHPKTVSIASLPERETLSASAAAGSSKG